MIKLCLVFAIFVAVAIDLFGAAQETDMNGLCSSLTCEFCLNLKCAWTLDMGCLSSCDNVEVICVQKSDNNSSNVCTTNRTIEESSSCDGLSCESCLGVDTCAWSKEEGCISSCDNKTECFPSSEYSEIEVCTSGVVDDACDGLKCEECLGNDCDWAPEHGCLLNCSIFDTGCFPGAVYDAFEVCGESPSTETPTSSARQISSIVGFIIWALSLASMSAQLLFLEVLVLS